MVPAHVTNLREAANQTLAGRITAGRQRLFVGRAAELDYFERFLQTGHDHPVWSITGPAGIGKTMLAQTLVQHANDCGVPVAYLDAHSIPSNPEDAHRGLVAAMGSRELADFGAGDGTALLVIDGLEAWQDLRAWLRDDYLPLAPMSLRIVLCGRLGPDLQWRTDQGWRAVMTHTQLAGLTPEQCAEYLERRGVPGDRHADLIEFANGHPLALAMAADSTLAGHRVQPGNAGGPATLTVLVESFSSEARDEAQRQALDACAIVRELNEPLLARMLGRDDVAPLFDWLRGLSFVQLGDHGIRPHDLVREVLLRDMPARAPQRYEAYANAVIAWTVEQITTWPAITWSTAAQMLSDSMYALRGLPLVAQIASAGSTRSLYFDHGSDPDWPALHDMIRRHEGDDEARWFTFWQNHHPEAVYVIRGTDATARGFFVKLDMQLLAPEHRAADPVTRRLWAFLQDELPLHPGDHVPFIRHAVTHDNALTQSPEHAQILLAVNAYNLVARNLRATAQVRGETPLPSGIRNALGIRMVPGSEMSTGGVKQHIDYVDWQRERPARYYGQFFQRMLAIQQHLDGRAAITADAPAQLPDEQAFKQAVGQALRHFQSDEQLAANPLAEAALMEPGVPGEAPVGSRVAVLRETIREAAASLDTGNANTQQWGKALRRGYLEPAINHKAAATALNLSYPTFRRRLSAARKALADTLWQWEQQAR